MAVSSQNKAHSNGLDATYKADIGDDNSLPPSPPSTRPSSPVSAIEVGDGSVAASKKKKKKKKKSKNPARNENPPHRLLELLEHDRAPVLCISRNKHWRYISSYHGPWLQLPVELLDSLLLINLDPATLSSADQRPPALPAPPAGAFRNPRRARGFASLGDHSPPDSPHGTFAELPPPPPLPAPKPGKATPPPIDPGVFRSVAQIRRLIDEASELSVRASSGLSAAALGNLERGNPYGLNDMGNGRNSAMSATRIHRLRALAVQKLAAAYKIDEIASSVMVMQGGSIFDDIAERVLKSDPHDVDARYVHFFHEKIPSRQMAETTTTHILDSLIAVQPNVLEFFRTRGIVHCFRDEYALAIKDFSHVIKESRVQRKARIAHRTSRSNISSEQRGKSKKKGKGKGHAQTPTNGSIGSPPSLDGPTIDGPDGEPLLLHPSVLPDAPEPYELQCIFLRGAAYLQHAAFIIEEAILKLEGIHKEHSMDGIEFRLCNIEHGRYGGVEVGNLDGPLGSKDGPKVKAYKRVLADESFREQVTSLIKKSMRDHEKFLSHFDTLEGPPIRPENDVDLATKVENAFLLSQSFRPGSSTPPPPPLYPDSPGMFTTYHPLLVESHFSILIAHMMLGDFPALLTAFPRAALIVDGLEGYPVFLPPRSMAQAEFLELLERLASGWRTGVQPHSQMRLNRLAIEAVSRSPKAKEVDRSNLSVVIPEGTSGSSRSVTPVLGINGSSSSSAYPASGPPSGSETPTQGTTRIDLEQSLDSLRMMLVPVAAKQRDNAMRGAIEKAAARDGKKKPLSINIPLHGPRVEIILAWLAAVYLVELENIA